MIGKQILNYKITRKIGSGGMATVYEAIHTKLDTKVAIKVLDPVLAANESIRQRFMQEAKIMASLNNEGITKVLDFDDEADYLAIIMEYLEGKTLDEYVKQKGALSEQEAKEIFIPVLKAFAYAHNKGIVHRDVKPSNIFITTEGKVKIMDFGIAKLVEDSSKMLTQTGTQMGTPVYMSPEQVHDSKHIDHRTDIYSLGVTLWFMLAGKPPYNAENNSSFDIFTKIANNPLPKLSHLDNVIAQATRKDMQNRLVSCDEFQKAIIGNLKITGKQEVPPITGERTQIEINNNEEEIWEKTKKKNTIDEYEYFLKMFPKGKHKEEASKAIGKLILTGSKSKHSIINSKEKNIRFIELFKKKYPNIKLKKSLFLVLFLTYFFPIVESIGLYLFYEEDPFWFSYLYSSYTSFFVPTNYYPFFFFAILIIIVTLTFIVILIRVMNLDKYNILRTTIYLYIFILFTMISWGGELILLAFFDIFDTFFYRCVLAPALLEVLMIILFFIYKLYKIPKMYKKI